MKDIIEKKAIKETKIYKTSKIALLVSIIISIGSVLEMLGVYFITTWVVKDMFATTNEREAKIKEVTTTPLKIGLIVLLIAIVLLIGLAIFKKYQERKALKYQYQLKDAIELKENIYD